MKKLTLICATLAGLMGIGEANAATVSYAGANCKPSLEGLSPMYGNGIIQNIDSNIRHFYDCPFQHSGRAITSIIVRVADRHSTEQIMCFFTVRESTTGDVLRGPERSTTGNSATGVQLSLGSVADADISTNHAGSITCRLPQTGSGFSSINSYRVTEAD